MIKWSPVRICACVFHLCGVCVWVLVRSRHRWWVQRLPDCYWLHLCCNRPRDGAPNPIFARNEPHSPPTQANRRAGHFHPDLTRKQHTMLLASKQCLLWNKGFQGCTKVCSVCYSISLLILKQANVNSRARNLISLVFISGRTSARPWCSPILLGLKWWGMVYFTRTRTVGSGYENSSYYKM